MNPALMNRREAIARIGLLLGGAMVGGDVLLRGETLAGKTAPGFTAEEIALLDEIGDTIIPATDTPGAKAAGIGAFMVMMVQDCYDDAHHAIFKAGIAQVDAEAKKKFGQGFLALAPAQRTELLNALDREIRQHPRKQKPAHYFRMMKELTLLGYFTSEIGASQALRYVEVPGGFDGNAPYKKGDRAWFVDASRSI
jgi:hypothetical protein